MDSMSAVSSPEHAAEDVAALKEKIKRQETLLNKCKDTIRANKVV